MPASSSADSLSSTIDAAVDASSSPIVVIDSSPSRVLNRINFNLRNGDGNINDNNDEMTFTLRRVEAGDDPEFINAVRALLVEYINGLGIDLSFQDISSELAELPGDKYSTVGGGALYVLLATTNSTSGTSASVEGAPSSLDSSSSLPSTSSPSTSSPPTSSPSISSPSSPSSPSPSPSPSSPPSPASATQLVGCVALKSLSLGVAEVKRLFVSPGFRGLDLGRLLLLHALSASGQAGYSKVRLDTLARLTSANALYAALGFKQIEAYNVNPEQDVLYFELKNVARFKDIGSKDGEREEGAVMKDQQRRMEDQDSSSSSSKSGQLDLSSDVYLPHRRPRRPRA